MSEAKTERGTLWGDDAAMALIEIWVDEGIQQQLDSCTRKRPIFEKIAKRLWEEGEYRHKQRMRNDVNPESTQLCVYTALRNECSVNESGFNPG